MYYGFQFCSFVQFLCVFTFIFASICFLCFFFISFLLFVCLLGYFGPQLVFFLNPFLSLFFRYLFVSYGETEMIWVSIGGEIGRISEELEDGRTSSDYIALKKPFSIKKQKIRTVIVWKRSCLTQLCCSTTSQSCFHRPNPSHLHDT